MFQLNTQGRTYGQNLRLAIFLSFSAGLINIIGLLQFGELVTHVTGHFTHFANALSTGNFTLILQRFGFLFSFIFGAMAASVLVIYTGRWKEQYSHTFALLIEIAILFFVLSHPNWSARWNAYLLLFAMGLQNALVTRISGAVVRTTHLTGISTDLGIELVSLFHSQGEERKQITRRLSLQSTIVTGFVVGGIGAVFLFSKFHIHALLLPIAILTSALIYDAVHYQLHHKKDLSKIN
ncbi:YoaK family protein [Persicobacter psychrovividus]|uniref:DUF1275 family protein n=1 Tax=Persicobacter psychrovividus TaxID=387638 RepID=A0ABM7VG83_9BACT|nr:DUF1275 family protein [Persicobacter psychrovividus]